MEEVFPIAGWQRLRSATRLSAGNTSSNADDISSAALTSNGANFVGDATGTTLAAGDKTFASTSTTITDLLNTTLADNGGPTLTHALVTNSPAIDCGNDADVPMTSGAMPEPEGDQTGGERISDGDGDSTARSDIGALEADLMLTITIAEASISENGGTSNVTVTRNGGLAQALDVTIASDNTSKINPATPVQIPATQASHTFTITGDDGYRD